MPLDPYIQEAIRRALAEDVGNGDITSELTIDDRSRSNAVFSAKESFVLAGMPFVQEVFHQVDPELTLTIKKKEGVSVKFGDLLAEAAGRTRSLLMAERTALNILQRVSGIATLTRQFVEAVKGTGVRITDTRKTTLDSDLLKNTACASEGAGIIVSAYMMACLSKTIILLQLAGLPRQLTDKKSTSSFED